MSGIKINAGVWKIKNLNPTAMNEQKRRLTQQADRTLTGAIAQKKKVSNQSSGFTDNRPESAEYGKIVASIRAKAGNIPLQRNVTLASAVIQRQINDGDYNAARNTLIAAGSTVLKLPILNIRKAEVRLMDMALHCYGRLATSSGLRMQGKRILWRE